VASPTTTTTTTTTTAIIQGPLLQRHENGRLGGMMAILSNLYSNRVRIGSPQQPSHNELGKATPTRCVTFVDQDSQASAPQTSMQSFIRST
jgi:hypothetical protein